MAHNTEKVLRAAAGTLVGEEAALTTEPAAAPAGGTGVAAGGYDTAGNRDTMITCVNDTRTRVGEIEAALKLFGFLT